tara:strand:+ start:484 stop:1029 length:546 start_codon:yes stop_codon:yes gene_type:complete
MAENRSTTPSDNTQPNQKTRWLEQMTIWPHRSLSPKGFAIVMGALAGFLFIIGLGFFLAGAWPVIGFLGLELLVVWGAFKLNYRAARHRETIHTTTEELMVESQTPAGKRAQKSFPIGWLRVSLSPAEPPVMSSRDRQKIILSSHGEQAEIGKYLHPAEKAGLSRELGAMIDRARATRDAG